MIPSPFLRLLATAWLALALPLFAQFAARGPNLRLNGFVFAVETDSAGNVYLGGSFNEFNGDETRGLGLLRLTPGGARHERWDIGFIDGVNDLLVSGNFLYVAGSFTTVRTLSSGTISRPHLLRIHLSGPLEGRIDRSWVPLPDASVSKIASDGTSLYLAGNFAFVNGVPRSRLAKILTGSADPDALDPAWNPGADHQIADIACASSWLYVSGDFSSAGGVVQNYLLRLSTSGSGAADAAWLPAINRPVGDLELSASHLYFGGDFTNVNGAVHRSVGRFAIGGATPVFDGGWRPDPDGEVSTMALSGSSLYVGGVFTRIGGAARRFMAKVDTAGGAVDAAFNPQPNGAIRDLKAVGNDVLGGGRFDTSLGSPSAGYAMFSGATGAALPAFAGTIRTQGQVYSMLPVSGGMIIGGLFDSVNGTPRTSIAKILPDGSVDPSFNVPVVGFNRLVSDLKLDGGMVYFCGDFLTVGGAPTKHVARVNATTGAVDAGWFTSPLTPILCLETDASHVYLGSAGLRFIELAPDVPFQVNNLARVSKGATAVVDQGWTPYIAAENGNPAIASVNDMEIVNGNLIIGGHFIFVVNPADTGNPYQRLCLAALSTTGWGQPLPGWGNLFFDANSDVGTIGELLVHNGALYAAGNFQILNQMEYYYVAKFDPSTGAHDANFDVSPVDSSDPFGAYKVRSLAASGNHLYVGGDFDLVFTGMPPDGFEPSPYIARVSATTGLLDPSWYPYPDGSITEMAVEGQNLWTFGTFNEAGGELVDGFALLTPFSSVYQDWLNRHFTPSELANSDYTTPWRDLDGDGDSNLVEAYFDTDPFDSTKRYHTAGTGTSGLPLIRQEMVAGQRYLTVEFTRWKDSAAGRVTGTPRFSDDLLTWPRDGEMIGTATSIGTDRERVKFRDPLPLSGRGFGRVDLAPQAQ